MSARTHNGLEGAPGNGRIAQSYLAGIGASGALLAGAVVTFVFLVGTVSFEVWPAASDRGSGAESLPVAQLAGPAGEGANPSLSAAVGQLAAAVPAVEAPAKSSGGPKPGGGSDEGSGNQAPAAPPVTDTPGDGGSGTVGEEPGNEPPAGGDSGSDRPNGGGDGQGDRGNSGSSTGGSGTGTQGGSQSGSTGNTGSDHTQRGSSRGR